MLLDLADDRVRAQWKQLPGGRFRLTLDVPAESDYCQPVFRALEELLTPKPNADRQEPTGTAAK